MEKLLANFDAGEIIWQVVIPVMLVGAAIVVAWSPLKKIMAHRCLQGLIKKLGPERLRHFTLIDDADIPLFVEYLILQADGLLLLIVKPYRGNIFAAKKIENWTQVIRHHSFKFPNPLHELDTNLQVLRAMFPKVNVRGLIVFAQGASFPKGKPENVYDFDELKDIANAPRQDEIPPSLRDVWQQLEGKIQTDKNLHPVIFYQRGDKRRLFMGIFLLIACLIYTVSILGWMRGLL